MGRLGEFGIIPADAEVHREFLRGAELVLEEEGDVSRGEIELGVADRLSKLLPVVADGATGRILHPGKVIGEIGKGSVVVAAELVAEDVEIILRRGEVRAEFPGVFAGGPVQGIGELEALFGGVEAGVVDGGAEVGLALDGEAEAAGAGGDEGRVDVIEQPIFEPAEADFIDDGVGWNGGPTGTAVAGADGGVGVVADAVSVGQHGLGLDAVGGDPAEVVAGEAEAVAVTGAPVDFGKAEFGVGCALEGLELAGENGPGGGASGGGSVAGGDEVARAIEQIGADEAVDEREVAAGEFDVREVEELVFLDCAADGAAELLAFFVWIDGGVTVAGVEILIAEEPVGGAVEIVATGAGDGVDDAAVGSTELGGVTVREHLELLDGVLGDLGADAGAAGVFVIELIGGVVAVGKEGVAAGDAAEGDEAEGAVLDDGRGEEHEAVDAATVDGEGLDLSGADDLGDAGFCRFDERGGLADIDLGCGAGDVERDVEVDALADLDFEALGFVGGKAGFGDLNGVARSGD